MCCGGVGALVILPSRLSSSDDNLCEKKKMKQKSGKKYGDVGVGGVEALKGVMLIIIIVVRCGFLQFFGRRGEN